MGNFFEDLDPTNPDSWISNKIDEATDFLTDPSTIIDFLTIAVGNIPGTTALLEYLVGVLGNLGNVVSQDPTTGKVTIHTNKGNVVISDDATIQASNIADAVNLLCPNVVANYTGNIAMLVAVSMGASGDKIPLASGSDAITASGAFLEGGKGTFKVDDTTFSFGTVPEGVAASGDILVNSVATISAGNTLTIGTGYIAGPEVYTFQTGIPYVPNFHQTVYTGGIYTYPSPPPANVAFVFAICADTQLQAIAIRDTINRDSKLVTARIATEAWSNASKVYITAKQAGATGNQMGYSTNCAGLTLNGSKLTGGADSALGSGTVLLDADKTKQAENIATAINAALATVEATSEGAVCTVTAAAQNDSGNSIVLSSQTEGLTASTNMKDEKFLDGGVTESIGPYGDLYEITDESFPEYASSVCYQSGYFVVTEKDTNNFFVSEQPNDARYWTQVDLMKADSNADPALRVMASNGEVWVFGSKSVEPHYNTGSTTGPFSRVQGAVLEMGVAAAGSITRIQGQFYWLTDNLRIVRNQGYQAQIISTPTLDYQLTTYATVADAIGYTVVIEGHDWYVLAFPSEDKTWVYDIATNFWFEWESYSTRLKKEPWGRHRSNCAVAFDDKQIVGDYEDGNLYYLDINTYYDGEKEIRRIRTSQSINKDNASIIFNSVQVEFEAGQPRQLPPVL